jgi:hypothetical protein
MASDEYKKIEEAIAQAVEAYSTNKSQKISVLARQFDVPYRRLKRRLDGQDSRSTRQPSNKLLTDDQESAIVTWIQYLDRIGAPATTDMLRNCANSILQRNHPDENPPPVVGPNWPYRFTKRLPDQYKRIIQKPIDPKRLTAESLAGVQVWFERLNMTMKQYKIGPSNLYNMDETGFQYGRGKKEYVITANPTNNNRIGSDSTRESLTLVECISASGWCMNPLIIFAGKVHMEEWFLQDNLDDDWQIAVTPNGYISDELAFEWLQKFDFETQNQAKSGYRMLLMDNHRSHTTYEFLDFCNKKNIICVAFPPHSTHKLQPLDGAPFQQYKNHHGKAVNQQARLGSMEFNKNDFLYSLRDIRSKTFTSRVIRSGFSGRGIHPYNPEIVLAEMREELGSDDDSTLTFIDGEAIPSSPTNASISPPRTAYKLRQRITKARKSLEEIEAILSESSPTLNRRLNRIFDGSLMQAELNAQRATEIETLRQLNGRKNTKRNYRQVQVGGILSVKDANRHIKARKVEEMKKSVRAAGREAKKRAGKNKPPEPTGHELFDVFWESPSQATGDSENPLFIIDTQGVQV